MIRLPLTDTLDYLCAREVPIAVASKFLTCDLESNTAFMDIPSKEVGDRHHTIGELYEHRYILWIALCREIALSRGHVWRSKLHSDGTMFPDSFVLGIHKEKGKQMVYHLPLRLWDKCDFAFTYTKAPEYDGHTPADTLKRIQSL